MDFSFNIKKIINVVIGSIITALGISLMVNGIYGVDTLSVFMSGLAKVLNVPFSVSNALVNFSIIIVVYIFDRKVIGWGSIINAGVIAVTIQLSSFYMGFVASSQWLSILTIILGPILIGIGAAIYVHQKLGASALESLTLCLCNYFRSWEIGYTRMALDFTFAVVGWFMGGTIGLATITCVLIVGPTMEIFGNFLSKKG